MRILKIDIHPKVEQSYYGNEHVYFNWITEAYGYTDIYLDQGRKQGVEVGDIYQTIYRHELIDANGEKFGERIELDYNLIRVMEVEENYCLAGFQNFAYQLFFDRFLGQKLSKAGPNPSFMSIFPLAEGQEVRLVPREENDAWNKIDDLVVQLRGDQQFTPQEDIVLHEKLISLCEGFIDRFQTEDGFFLERAYFQIGFSLHKLREFELSTKAFKEYLKRFPSGPSVVGAQNWINENELYLRQFAPKPKTRILFLSANPTNAQRSGIDRELREIEIELRMAKMSDQFELAHQMAVTPRQLQESLVKFEPDIVHFTGTANERGVVLENEAGAAKEVRTEDFAGIFKLMAEKISCVLLNMSHSRQQADMIHRFIPCVIGTEDEMSAGSSQAFSVGFYKALAAGKDFDFAFKLGENGIRLENPEEKAHPFLLLR
ncbi:MAG: hypothetical protein AAGD28_28555 [Bacteroidota bacterium]